jgi:hypothetical protein
VGVGPTGSCRHRQTTAPQSKWPLGSPAWLTCRPACPPSSPERIVVVGHALAGDLPQMPSPLRHADPVCVLVGVGGRRWRTATDLEVRNRELDALLREALQTQVRAAGANHRRCCGLPPPRTQRPAGHTHDASDRFAATATTATALSLSLSLSLSVSLSLWVCPNPRLSCFRLRISRAAAHRYAVSVLRACADGAGGAGHGPRRAARRRRARAGAARGGGGGQGTGPGGGGEAATAQRGGGAGQAREGGAAARPRQGASASAPCAVLCDHRPADSQS